MKILWQAIYREADKYRMYEGCSWRQLAENAGVTASAFTRLKEGKAISVLNLFRIAHYCSFLLTIGQFVKVKQA